MKCEVKHNWDNGMGHLWLNGWDIWFGNWNAAVDTKDDPTEHGEKIGKG